MEASGVVDLLYTTVADNTGVGLDNNLGGTYTVERSIDENVEVILRELENRGIV